MKRVTSIPSVLRTTTSDGSRVQVRFAAGAAGALSLESAAVLFGQGLQHRLSVRLGAAAVAAVAAVALALLEHGGL